MSFDSLIFILVIVAIILSNVFKMIKKTSDTGGAKMQKPSATGWKKKVSDVLAQIKEEMRKAAEQQTGEKPSGRGTGWEQVMVPSPRPDERGVKDTPELRQTFEEAIKKPYPPEPGPEMSVPGLPSYAAPATGAMYEQHRKQRAVVINRRNLRQAVIWSEILAKPVGLRDLEE